VAIEDLNIGGQPIHAGDFLVMNLLPGTGILISSITQKSSTSTETPADTWVSATAYISIGQNLARVEMQIAFVTLARRLPEPRLAISPDALRFKDESGIYGMKELPVTW